MALQSGPASDSIYMCFGSVPGEARTTLHISNSPASGGWIKLSSCNFGGRVSHPQLTTKQSEFEGEAQPVRVTKVTDASSVGLLREALTGRFDQPVVIVFVRTTNSGPAEYIRLEMQDCGIVEFDMAGGEERQTESYEIRCSMMTLTTWRFAGNTRGAQSVVVLNNEAGR
ncbi:type VI secretion system tube protein Hcp [Roseomonas eburnea]|uniref:Type VI secretion system tube protein Hcp n=1 Tax=Neoroseomonas eburnea TaxID=1346889 RepID=A0A9X9XK35_9PROT|nr:type VI secretion system tube protein Hcp [Neoroseomonas eburnea]MBR0684071.1 type VI secretion system tube protein Hcp [Neoroseomonas eburnea]